MRHARSYRLVAPVLLFLVGVSLSCCTPTPSPATSPLSTATSPLISPLPTEEGLVLQVTPAQVPTSSPDKGVVWGQIVDQQSGQAPLDAAVFLGELTSLDSGVPIVSLHRNGAPSARPSPDGGFAIADVPVGEYGVILFTPDVSFLLDDGQGGSMLIEVRAGQSLDLGKIVVLIP